MRLCAASRPVSSLPDSSNRSPGFQVGDLRAGQGRRATRAARCASALQVTFGHSARSGGSSTAGPVPSSVKCTWRVAAQFGITATGNEAACVG